MNKAKIIFIDDEKEILAAYRNIFDSEKKSSGLSKFIKKEKGSAVKSLAKELWKSYDFEIETAEQGLEGVEKILEAKNKKVPFQIAFIDMRMPPGINGVEAAKRIREIDSHIEIVIITAYSDLNLDEINNAIGSPDKLIYFKKPFYNEEIRQIVMNLAAKYKNERIKDDFISNVSHELRTPLSAISGFAKLLKSESSNFSEDQSEYLSILTENSLLMEQLIEELITSVQISRKGMKVSSVPQNPIPILRSVAKTMEPLFSNEEKVNFQVDIPDLDMKVSWDNLRIRQALINLINNALKFTSEGAVRLTCTQTTKGDLEVTVSDTGCGISAEQRDLIFDQFVRLEDKHHHIPGLGLGLSIVKEIINGHNAKILVDSEVDQGTSFRLIFKEAV